MSGGLGANAGLTHSMAFLVYQYKFMNGPAAGVPFRPEHSELTSFSIPLAEAARERPYALALSLREPLPAGQAVAPEAAALAFIQA